MNANIVDNTQILYNYDKEMSNMSYVIMMKCSDGIVCVSDSRLTTSIQNKNNEIYNMLKTDNAQKVFKNEYLLVGVFGNYTIGNNDIDVIISDILKTAKNKFELIEQIKNHIVGENNKTYSMFIGEKKNSTFEAFTVAINKNSININDFGALNYNANKTDFSHSNLPAGINLITVTQAKPLLISAVQNVIDIQSNLLPYAVVGGKVQCEVLQ